MQRRNVALLLFLPTAPTACGGASFERVVRISAANDFPCGGEVVVKRLTSYGYRAESCGETRYYRCSFSRNQGACCHAVRDEHDATAFIRIDRPSDRDTEECTPVGLFAQGPPPASEAPPPPEAGPPPPPAPGPPPGPVTAPPPSPLATEPPPPPEPSRTWRLGAEVGLAVPLGSSSPADLDEAFGARVPVLIYFGRTFGSGLSLEGGVGSTVTSTCTEHGCDGTMRVELGVEYDFGSHPAFASRFTIDPWIGYAAGGEWLSRGVAGGTETVWGTGIEVARLRAGVDFLRGFASVGPFVDFTTIDYPRLSTDANAGSTTGSVLRSWVTFGVRVAYF